MLVDAVTRPTVVVDADALGRVGTALADPTRRRLLLSFPSDLADRFGLLGGTCRG